MNRRRFLHSATGAAAVGLAGCLGDGGDATDTAGPATGSTPQPTRSPADDSTVTSTPDGPGGVYVQSFREAMVMPGTARAGDYRFALMVAVPHRFWTVNLDERSVTEIEEGDDVHLMATVWDPETQTVLPDSNLSVEITRDGDLVTQEVIYRMLSQRMGFHYGANFPLDGDGTYAARLSVGGVSARTTGAFEGRFDDGATAAVEFEWGKRLRERLTTEQLDQAGQRGALRPMEMGDVPQPRAPEPAALPGRVLGTGRSGDAKLVTTQVPAADAGRFTDGGPYLAVSARTPFNRLVLPAMALSASVARDGETGFEGPLEPTLDPELGHHYGAALPEPVQSGDEVTLRVGTPPQLARHEGYERAFLRMEPATITA
ncbi:fe2+ transport protein [Halosimplex litoreum]|uniref:Fe2+ transport protein n=1 Tax=Halosimplex litoreum TaxID=1198301 RepID=A0A7T3KU96_9EURY|nr:fe2+ transport protein [Halosimplex litoreum]QPV62054.1 fe2+ transport protein [Halosimplex litoreum]